MLNFHQQIMKKFLLPTFFLFFLCSCISRVEKHGYMFDLSDQEKLQEGITTRDGVLRAMGSPTVISDLDSEETWIYYSEDVKQLLFFTPEITDRTILVLRFDNENTVKEVKKITLNDEKKNIDFVHNYTAVDNHDVGFLKSFFSNVGQVRPQ